MAKKRYGGQLSSFSQKLVARGQDPLRKRRRQKTPGSGGADSGGSDSSGVGGGSATATIPPYGSFDPAFEGQRASSRRGLSDLVGDTSRDETRGREDLTTQLGDYLRSFNRGTEDIGKARTREGENFGFAKEGLDRKYHNLAIGQGQAINATGQIRGGALAAAAAKRTGNQAFEFKPIQMGHERSIADLATQEGRLGEDYSRNVNLANRGFGRGQEDRATNLSRATREQQLGEFDITRQEYFDASQRNPSIVFPSSQFDNSTTTQGGIAGQTQKKKKKK